MTTEYKDMSEFLESDRAAMAFYNTLPISLQQKLYRGGVTAFAELYAAAGKSPQPAVEQVSDCNTFSVTEFTGSVPEGGDKNTCL